MDKLRRIYTATVKQASCLSQARSLCYENATSMRFSLTLRNHNYLRITRILTSLKLLGLEKLAIALFNCLEKIYTEESQIIGSETFNYWQNAIKK